MENNSAQIALAVKFMFIMTQIKHRIDGCNIDNATYVFIRQVIGIGKILASTYDNGQNLIS